MNVFEAVKEKVKAIDALSMMGLQATRNNMVCCPFHNDKHPSMKVDQRYYCFACGAKGDVIDFVANYYGIGSKDAAERIASEFGISYEHNRYSGDRISSTTRGKNEYQIWAEQKRELFARLSAIHELLHNTKMKYAPKDRENSDWSSLFCLAVSELNRIDDLYDYCLFYAKDEDLKTKYEEITKEIDEIEKRINDAEYGTGRSDARQIRKRMAV